MNRFANINKPLQWFTALLFAAVLAGCGGQDPILGGGGSGTNAVAADTTRPRVTVTVPVDGSTTAPANTKITATFTEKMAAASITGAGTFTLAQSGVAGTVAGGPVTYTDGSKTADFKPSVDMTIGATYIATISTAATDLAGNALAGNQAALPAASDYMWIFTAAAPDNTPPTITLTTPASGVTGVALNATVNATFSEAMDASTISATSFTVAQSGVPGNIPGAYFYDAPSHIASFTPSSNLQASTDYVATITPGVTDLSGNALTAGATPNPWVFTTGTGLAPGAVALGSASTFGLMATSAITCVPTCIINGDVSLDPGTSITGPPVINGELHINDTVSAQARNDLLAAYNYAKNLPSGTIISGGADLGALYISGIPPGTYTSGSTMLVSTPLVLDAKGDSNAVWVFQIGSSFTTSADVTLANGAQAKNVFWVPTSDATIGVGTTFNGTIVAGRDTTAVSGSTINGRILSGAITAGTIALQAGTTVNVPAPQPVALDDLHQTILENNMNKMKKAAKTLATLGLVGCAVMSSPIAMADDTFWYIGGNIGQSNAKIDEAAITARLLAGGFSTSAFSEDKSDTAYKLFGGYQFNRNFALEGGYFNLGKFGYTATTVPAGTSSGNIKLSGLNLDAVGMLPVTERFSVFGRLGLQYAQAKDEFTSSGAVGVPVNPNPSKNALNYKAGVGVQYDFSRSLGLRAEAERYRIEDAVNDKGDINMYSIGLVYRFDQRKPAPVEKVLMPKQEIVVVHAPPPPAPPPVVIVLTKVVFSADSDANALFTFGKTALKPTGKRALDKFAAELKGANYQLITITGHTDRIGSNAANMKLSIKRAEVVKDYLVASAGIPADKISVRGAGESHPLTKPSECKGTKPTKKLVACLAPDRRVEVDVTGTRPEK